MPPFTIDPQLIDAVERHVNAALDDRELLHQVAAACPSASLRDIAQAALFAATDTSREDARVAARLFYFAMSVRKAA